MAMAPELTIGFVRPSVAPLHRLDRVEGEAGGVDPEARRAPRRGPSASHTSAKMNGLATLMIVNAASASPAACTAAHPDDADPEQDGSAAARAG